MKIFISTNDVVQYILNNWLQKDYFILKDFVKFLGEIILKNSRINRKRLILKLLENKILFFIDKNYVTFNKTIFEIYNKNIIVNHILEEFEELKNNNDFPLIFVSNNILKNIYSLIGVESVNKEHRNTPFLYSMLYNWDIFKVIQLSQIWNDNFQFVILEKDKKCVNKLDLYKYLILKFYNGEKDSENIFNEVIRLFKIGNDQFLFKKLIKKVIRKKCT